MSRLQSILSAVICLATMCLPAEAADNVLRPDDPNLPEDFVIASIVAADPGGALYSKAGHIAIRMQCKAHKLDYVFSYESEDASERVLLFLAGKLKMGLAAIPFEDFLSTYRKEGRGVTEYQLNIPLNAKQNLWRILDNHMIEGMDLPYDYMKRGCALGTMHLLKEGLDTIRIEYGKWPEHFSGTRREIARRQVKQYSWTTFFLELICNKPIDDPCPKEEKIIMPADFIDVMGRASINGNPLMDEGRCILTPVNELKPDRITPLHISLVILLLTILCAIKGKRTMQYALLFIQSAIGAVSTYLVFFSDLCFTQWSWLLVPFNLLPLIFWKWRNYWKKPFGIICALWATIICLLPHLITDWPYVILAFALSISYFGKEK